MMQAKQNGALMLLQDCATVTIFIIPLSIVGKFDHFRAKWPLYECKRKRSEQLVTWMNTSNRLYHLNSQSYASTHLEFH